MKQKDIIEKYLEDYNDVFADIINVLLFQGTQKVLPDALHLSSIKSRYKADDAKLHELERDTVKLWKEEEIEFAIIGMENQTKVDLDMPLRIIGYDGASYRGQLLNKQSKRRYPVVTMILYFGTERWCKPKNLKALLEIPKELDDYVSDYKINVFEIAWLTDEQVNMFQSDFRIVADYFTQTRKYNDYVPSNQEIKHVDAVLKMLSVFTNDKRFEETFSEQDRERRGITMCEVLDRAEERGMKRGIEQGVKALVETCREFGASDNDVVSRLMQKFSFTKENAEACFRKYAK